MKFKKYQHIERYETDKVKGIEIGTCYIFPKIDGTNASVWLDNGEVCVGSRNRKLSLEHDNGGFYKFVSNDKKIKEYLFKNPTHRLYGEWLIPHSLRTYRDDAWQNFYIFDVCIDKEMTGKSEYGLEYLPYKIYQPLLEEFDLEYLAPIAIINNGNYENFIKCTEQNIFLIQENKGVGEGIVIKNYDYYNRNNDQIWAKVVTNEFKEKSHRIMGAPEVNYRTIEEIIVKDFITSSFVEKEYAKIVVEQGEWKPQYIPMFLGKIFHELINEEIWNIIKKYKNPKIDFNVLNILTTRKIKSVKPEIFQK